MRRGLRRMALGGLTVLLVFGCRPHSGSGEGTTQSTQHSGPTVSILIDSLVNLAGSFVSTGPGRWDFTGDMGVLRAFEQHGDAAVIPLVHCLDRSDTTRATFAGHPVLLGYMCYAALQRVAYYEWHQYQDYTTDPSWEGMLEPSAGLEALRSARSAWEEVVRLKRYVLH